MPIERKENETRDEFVSRCVVKEMDGGMPQDQALAVCLNYADEYFAKVGERGAIAESKKAPKSDTPNPDPKGEGTAKGDASSTRGAEVTERVEKILSDKVKDFNERYKDKLDYGVNIGMLKSVYQRGVGAFNVSHSPRVQSAEQWALARVNAFLYIVKNGRPENPKYTNDFDLLPKDHPKNPSKKDDKKDDMAKSATASVSDATWSGQPAISINLETYNDYPEAAKNAACKVLRWREEHGDEVKGMTRVGWTRANQLCSGENISEETIARMSAFQRHRKNSEISPEFEGKPWQDAGYVAWLGWGGDEGIEWASRKLEQIRKEKQNLSRVRKVLFEESVSDETILDFKNRGFKVYIRSERKIQRKDRKVWNRLKKLGLSDQSYLYGDAKNIDSQKEIDIHFHNDDPILHTLLMKSKSVKYRKVVHEEPVYSIADAEEKQQKFLDNFKMKFAKINIFYEYKVRTDVPPAESGSRPFCKKLMDKGGQYTLDEIKALSNQHLKEMFKNYSLEPDVFLYRGGFYRLPGTTQTTPYCRHEWVMRAVFI